MGGNVPLGYEVKDRALIINAAEAHKVRLIYRRYLKLGSVHALAENLDKRGIRSHRRVTQVGKMIGGRPLTRGHLYLILKNPLYLGMVVHKGKSYPGLHQPIIERKTWERVQEQLASNRTDHRRGRRARVPSLLTGLLFDSAGERLTSSHAQKDGCATATTLRNPWRAGGPGPMHRASGGASRPRRSKPPSSRR